MLLSSKKPLIVWDFVVIYSAISFTHLFFASWFYEYLLSKHCVFLNDNPRSSTGLLFYVYNRLYFYTLNIIFLFSTFCLYSNKPFLAKVCMSSDTNSRQFCFHKPVSSRLCIVSVLSWSQCCLLVDLVEDV